LQKPFFLVVLVLCGFTSGCWESEGSLYGDTKAIQPFRPGKILASNRDQPGKVSHFVLTREANGTYRLTNADKGTDFGDAMVLRFFALAGLPKDMVVSEAVTDDKCKPGDICHPVTAASERMYGLVRLTKDGAEINIPDCDKSSAVAKLTGVEADSFGDCRFKSRVALETALRIRTKRIWKSDLTYRYE
jgi:hypothetical protein